MFNKKVHQRIDNLLECLGIHIRITNKLLAQEEIARRELKAELNALTERVYALENPQPKTSKRKKK